MMHSSEMNYRVSVIIPVYNRENTIKRCIDSIIRQTYPASEIIVVDDGSTDSTLETVQKNYGGKVKIVRQHHKGAQAARNTGIRIANGEYIAFLDSDDEWMKNKLELQIRALQKDKQAAICGDGYVQKEWCSGIPKVYRRTGNKQIVSRSKKQIRMNGKSGNVYREILKNSFCLFSTLLTAKENLMKIGLLDENVPSYQEWDTAIRLAKRCNFIYIHRPLFIYYLHDGETISKSTKKGIDGQVYIYEKYKYEILCQLGKQELVQRYKQIMQMCMQYGDVRIFEYSVKYILAKKNVFLFGERGEK